MAFKFVVLSALLAVASAGIVGPYVAPAVALAHNVHYANPAVDAVASTHQNVVRSFGGTVSHHSKTVDTPYSSVRKQDTRISNNVYTPALAKTVTYAAPAPTTSVYTHATPVHSQTVYASSAPTTAYSHYQQHHEAAPTTAYSHYQQHQEALPTAYTHLETAAPTAAVYTHSTPVVTKTVNYAAPAPTAHSYQHQTPVVQSYHHQAPAAHVYQQQVPVAHVYQQQAPVTHVYHKEAPAGHVYHQEAPITTTTYNHGPAASTYTHNAPGIAAYGSSQTVRYSPAEAVSHMSFDGFGTHWGF